MWMDCPLCKPGYSQAAKDVLAERQRQVIVKGWTAEHDDEHDMELVDAAVCYAETMGPCRPCPTAGWPWKLEDWKPKDRRKNLERAAALIIAHMDAMDRYRAQSQFAKCDGNHAVNVPCFDPECWNL
jgi:hypothetical protein